MDTNPFQNLLSIAGLYGGRGDAGQPSRLWRAPPPQRETTASRIAIALRTEILSMRLVPRSPIEEKALTEQFAVSRTPVREALIRLAEDGLVSIFPQSGTFVAPIPVAAVREGVIIRLALELAALDLLFSLGEAADLGPVTAAIARQRTAAEAGDAEVFHEADEDFHAAIANVVGFPGIWRTAQSAKMQFDRCRRLTLPVQGRMQQVIGEHLGVFEAVRAGDRELARQRLTAHLTTVIPDLVRLRTQYPDFFS